MSAGNARKASPASAETGTAPASVRACVRHRWVFGEPDPATGINEIKCERCGEPQPPEGVEGNLWTPPAP